MRLFTSKTPGSPGVGDDGGEPRTRERRGRNEFSQVARLPARALYKQKVESGVMAPVDGGCETEDKGRGSARRGREGENRNEVRR